jgi:hypothetical protein
VILLAFLFAPILVIFVGLAYIVGWALIWTIRIIGILFLLAVLGTVELVRWYRQRGDAR